MVFAVGGLVAGQIAGHVDNSHSTTVPLSEAIVGNWHGTLYVADPRQNFGRVDIELQITGHGILRYRRGPYTALGVARPVEDVGIGDYMVIGDSVLLSQHTPFAFQLTLPGVRVTGEKLEFVISPGGDGGSGTLIPGGYVPTRR
jgi:hypothetical protein